MSKWVDASDVPVIGFVVLWFLYILGSLAVSIGAIWAIIHFVRKFW